MRNRDLESETPLSALIDVVFLLIIFFVVTASLQQDTVDRQVQLAESRNIPPEPKPTVTFTVNLRQQPETGNIRYSVRGEICSRSQLRRKLLAARGAEGPELAVVIRADKYVAYREIESINALIRESGLYRVRHASTSHFQP